MDNAGVARILGEIADLLEIKGENPFKIRAYRNGADIVSNHPHALGTLDESGLREIPGIGKDLAALLGRERRRQRRSRCRRRRAIQADLACGVENRRAQAQ